MNWPSVDDRPLHGTRESSDFAEMAVDLIETTARGGAGVLLVLTECNSSLHSVTGEREGGEVRE